jgi:hypothetical protein
MKTPKRLILLIVLLGLVSAGCQTFTLTEEDFEKQQRGASADPQVGAAVGAAGTIGYLGAMIGCAAAGVK